MKHFAALVYQLGTSTKTNDKLLALQDYFAVATDADKVWVIAIFSGRRPKRIVNTALLQQLCLSLTQIPEWLFLESYHTVGDLAETITLLLPPSSHSDEAENLTLSYYVEQFVALDKADEAVRKQFIIDSWQQLDSNERFVFNKLITGGFRIGVSQKMMVNALAKITGLSPSVIAHRISGNWNPTTTNFTDLLSAEAAALDSSKPYPFYLAYALDAAPETLGAPHEWQAEWKWDGIRGQVIKRNADFYVWSRGEELMTEKFPEYQVWKDAVPDGTVLDGEIIPAVATNGQLQPLPFALLQTRIGRKTIAKKQLQEVPVAFFAYDLLEYKGEDIRHLPLLERRQLLKEIVTKVQTATAITCGLFLSDEILFDDWRQLFDIRTTSRTNGAEGLMLKRKNSPYQTGRKIGDWWKWKIDPLTIDAVMIYAQKGHGRRSNLYTDYTFAVKDGDRLVSFTKAYSGLTDKEFIAVDAFVKRNAVEKFGPVRTVKPELVFEIAFEGIAASNRHKSGVALRFPRISRWRQDKKVDDINTLDDLKQLLKVYGNT
jgi:DNA ligase-1